MFTGADMQADNIGGLPCGWQIHNKDGTPMAEPPHPVLAVDTVRHVGDPVAVVIAESRQTGEGRGREACDRLRRICPPSPTVKDAAAAGAPLVHDGVAGQPLLRLAHRRQGGGRCGVRPCGATVVKLDLVNNRLSRTRWSRAPRWAITIRRRGDYTLYTTSQNPHVIRLLMGAFVLHIPEHKLRVVAPDVGGGFGSKIFHYAEEAIVTWAARQA